MHKIMHRSTRVIIGIELASLALIAALGFAGATWREYAQAGVLACAIITGRMMLGWAKPRGHEKKIASIILIMTAVVFQIALFVLLGAKLGFVANVYRLNWVSITQVFLPITLITILTEVLRGQMVEKGRMSPAVIIMTAIVLSLMTIAIMMPMYLPLTAQSLCELILAGILPVTLTNILLTYIAQFYDYRANIAYQIVMTLPAYMLPIYPDANAYLLALFQVMLIVVLIIGFINMKKRGEVTLAAWLTNRMHAKRTLTDKQQKHRRLMKRMAAGAVVAVVLGYVALMSGLFRYHFLAIGSRSMVPAIERGDLVLVEKTRRYEQIAIGDVLVYWKQGAVLVHRVSEIEQSGKVYLYRTKGDANESADAWVVEQSDVIGVARSKIAMFGFPTIWLNEMFNKDKGE